MIKKVLIFFNRLLKISFYRPRAIQHIFGVAFKESERFIDKQLDIGKLPHVNIDELYSEEKQGDTRILLKLFNRVFASVSYVESYCLAFLMRKVVAKAVFEFGTYKGVSTTQLALNLESGGIIYTLDLPEDSPTYKLQINVLNEKKIATEIGKGELIPDDLLSHIKFLKADSALFDESPYSDQMDFVFIDGAHSSDYVKNDSEKGWRMLRKEGIMVWHDCRLENPDVLRYVLNCGYNAKKIIGTSLAYAIKF